MPTNSNPKYALKFCLVLFVTTFFSKAILAQAKFSANTDFALGTTIGPQHIIFADINSDGRPDIVTANQNSGGISMLLNTTPLNAATPTFSSVTAITSGTQPHSVSAGDINGDGVIDLAVANSSSNTVSIFLNTTVPGAAAPTLAAKVDLTTGSTPYSVILKDINGDGKLDVIAGAQGATSNFVSVFINTTATGAPTASFAARVDFATGNGPTHVWVDDLNNDGKPDIATANNTAGTVSVLLNTTATGAATPTFAPKVDLTAGTTTWSVTAADINKDGKLDLIAANRGGNSISVFLNTTANGGATPSFTAKTDFTAGSTPIGIIATDVNADGLPDIQVVSRGTNAVLVMYNVTAPGAATPAFSNTLTLSTGASSVPYFPAAADINGDGKMDVAVGNNSTNAISVFMNTSTQGAAAPTFAPKTDFTSAAINSSAIVAGDINLDGIPDVVQGYEGTSSVSVFLNTITPGAATAAFAAKTDFTVGGASYGVVLSDLNGDGKKDIISTAYAAGKISVLLNTTTPGAATPSMSAKTDFTVGTNPAAVAQGDLNGDGKPDIVTANNGSSNISVLLNTTAPGAATPSFAAANNFAAPAGAYAVAIKDVNSDGKPDIIVSSSTSAVVSVLLNTTTPGASTPTFAAKTDFTTGAGSLSIVVTDMNGDGLPDIAVVNASANTVSVLLNTTAAGAATASFSTKTDFAVGTSPKFITAGDLNLDGLADLAITNQGSSNFSVLKNTTAAGASVPSFAAAQNVATSAAPRGITNADISMDGKTDIILADNASATFSAILNTTAPAALPLQLLSFTARKENNSVLLNWQTANELNTDHFSVQRSANGVDFNSVNTQPAKGGSASYTAQDNLTESELRQPVLYYRLSMVDKDGKSSLSKVAIINQRSKTAISIFPNPVKDQVVVSGNAVTVELFDAMGRSVLRKQLPGNSNLLSLPGLKSGVYSAKFTDANGGVTTQQLVKE